MANKYPPKFEEFWKVYPRRVAKIPAAKAWEKQGVEDDLYNAKAAIDDVKKRSRMDWWPTDRSKIPHPSSWINAQRWHDEGWEDDIPGHDRRTEDPTRRVIVPNVPEREVSWQERMLNRIFCSYVIKSGGLPEVGAAIRMRDKIMDNNVQAIEEELAAETMTRAEAALMLAKLFLAHLDHYYKLTLGDRILSNAQRAARTY